MDVHGLVLVQYDPHYLYTPAHTQSVSSEGLREGLRVLGGSDPLSEVEHQALFMDISRGHDRVQYRVSETKITLKRLPSGTLRRERGRNVERIAQPANRCSWVHVVNFHADEQACFTVPPLPSLFRSP